MSPQRLQYLAIAMMAMTLSWVPACGSRPAEDRLSRLVPAKLARTLRDGSSSDQAQLVHSRASPTGQGLRKCTKLSLGCL